MRWNKIISDGQRRKPKFWTNFISHVTMALELNVTTSSAERRSKLLRPELD